MAATDMDLALVVRDRELKIAGLEEQVSGCHG